MKYYKLKKNDACIWCDRELFINKEEAFKKYKGGFFHHIPTFEKRKCKSIEELKKCIFNIFDCYAIKHSYSKVCKLVNEVIEKIKIETFEINYPDQPCIVVQYDELDECDARTPIEYLKSAKELENKNYNFYYEVYLINNKGALLLDNNLGTEY